ncbi:MAG: hypothetical protein ACYS67_19340, partial [Planctomycetota bacterium]
MNLKLLQRSKFLSEIKHIQSYIDALNEISALSLINLCNHCAGLLYSIYENDRTILSFALKQFNSDISEICFDPPKELTYSPEEGICSDGVAFWGEMLQQVGLIEESAEFCDDLLSCYHSLRYDYANPRSQLSEDSGYESCFISSSRKLVEEFYFATFRVIFEDASNKCASSCLPFAKYRLEELRDLIIRNGQAQGPFVLGDGHEWDWNIGLSHFRGRTGILSVRPSISEKKLELKLECKMDCSVEKVSWFVYLNSIYDYQLF